MAALVRAYGIPMITGVANVMEEIPNGIELLLDGGVGEVILSPTEDDIKKLLK